MGDWTEVLIHGTFDGFTFSTDELTRINVVLGGGEIVEVPEDFVVSADQMVNKHKIKLKDVIARIEKFDLGTKAVWLNEILYKLGSDYGLHKYYAGYKQGKFDGAMEREKVKVPQFVADWIEYAKFEDYHLLGAMDSIAISGRKNLDEWFRGDDDNMELFARAWLDGYEVEKEKRYEVILCNGQSLKTVYRQGNDRLDFEKVYGDLERFTRKQLEEDGFGWVFDCPGMEVREVE
ncbi:DUF1642 domain-containing protein [Streptococcus parasanguinis]|uniref:DUF1642 domain-containing protein n=1 Tax=Streptococcus parasanguinis TaxID=1318 RepID=UPI0020C8B953|nr:DUF1642 domain-containing protein [Streptococcus parasanguinis]MCP8991158.1 DUF1642 domain-containing protein [Streptococcus parasanguinis]MCP9032991.1 DUF1642 domain-containing protein [Streptococcus parasanguinis]MCP9040765.1 DUF1642 domain-containing protein [Streptococcus parasanguinis]MCP9044719.1 DUF1642 domain-containing protein [Streptococcus parasanguinis]MCP9053931.1 DUF1642 domain-containing protein [Streptococcus parasanguinis]